MKAQELKTKTSANSDIQDLPSRYQDYQDNDCQGRLLASFQYDAKYEHGVYEFSDLNPFAGHLDPVREGHELFRKGLLSEAVLALDAEVLRNPDNAEGSPMLMVTEMTKHIRVRASRGKTTPSELG
ncbi:peroxisome biogenesis protein 5 isoform X1 [Tanacetum coccineum]